MPNCQIAKLFFSLLILRNDSLAIQQSNSLSIEKTPNYNGYFVQFGDDVIRAILPYGQSTNQRADVLAGEYDSHRFWAFIDSSL